MHHRPLGGERWAFTPAFVAPRTFKLTVNACDCHALVGLAQGRLGAGEIAADVLSPAGVQVGAVGSA